MYVDINNIDHVPTSPSLSIQLLYLHFITMSGFAPFLDSVYVDPKMTRRKLLKHEAKLDLRRVFSS